MHAQDLDRLAEAYSQVSVANRRMLNKLAHVLPLFSEKGIDCILLQGADVLPRLYGVRGIRPMADVDLLVRERDLPAIEMILTGIGFEPQLDGNPAYRDPGSLLVLNLVTEIWYTDDSETVWARTVEREAAGLKVKGMGTEDLLIFLTAYTVLHRGHFQATFAQDIILLAGREQVDWDFVLHEASRLHLKIPLYHGLSRASRAEYTTIPARILLRLAPSTGVEKLWHALLKRLVTERPVADLGHLLILMALPWHLKLRRLQQTFWPSSSFLRYRYGGRGLSLPLLTRLARPMVLAWHAHLLAWRILGRLLFRPRATHELPF